MTEEESAKVASERTPLADTNGRLLEQIIAGSGVVKDEKVEEEQESESSEDGEEFEDGDAASSIEDSHEHAHDSSENGAAAVLTELSQATTTTTAITAPARAINNNLTNPNMAATINSINAFLQSHLHSNNNNNNTQPQKVRLSGPIRANINIRHGVWAPRLRCRKRKNLHAKDGIWIHQNCTLEQLVLLVKGVLPDDFEWDAQASPLRYQAVNDQSLQSLKTVSGTVNVGSSLSSSTQSLYSAFDLVRNRRSDGDNFILQLYVYGTWTVLLKSHLNSSTDEESFNSTTSNTSFNSTAAISTALQPPPKKKYQQSHFNQMQMMNNLNLNTDNGTANTTASSNNNSSSNNSESQMNMFSQFHFPPTQASALHAPPPPPPHHHIYTHPLSANPPVTFLPTVTLEMKLNGTFVPVEITRRSFVAAIRACSIPKTPNINTSNTNQDQQHHHDASNPANITPPPSDV